jgi:hypothetical protein
MDEFTQNIISLLQIPLINFISGALIALVAAYLYHYFSLAREESNIERNTQNVLEILNSEINVNKNILYENYKNISSTNTDYWRYKETQTKGIDILSNSLEKIKPDWERFKTIFDIYSTFFVINKETIMLSEYAKKEWEKGTSDVPNVSILNGIKYSLIKIWDYQKTWDYSSYASDNLRKNMEEKTLKDLSTSDNHNYRK